MTSEQPEQGRWRVESNEFLVSPEDRVMAQRTETVSVLHDLAGELNALEAYKALAVRAYEMLDLIQTWPEDWSSEFIDDVTRWVDDYDALTPSEKGDHCHAGRDGDCNWSDCPQKRDYQTYCPLAKATEKGD